jgi:hypothetical protein
MVVQYVWRTKRLKHGFLATETEWRGWFVLGFVPVYVWPETKTWYM